MNQNVVPPGHQTRVSVAANVIMAATSHNALGVKSARKTQASVCTVSIKASVFAMLGSWKEDDDQDVMESGDGVEETEMTGDQSMMADVESTANKAMEMMMKIVEVLRTTHNQETRGLYQVTMKTAETADLVTGTVMRGDDDQMMTKAAGSTNRTMETKIRMHPAGHLARCQSSTVWADERSLWSTTACLAADVTVQTINLGATQQSAEEAMMHALLHSPMPSAPVPSTTTSSELRPWLLSRPRYRMARVTARNRRSLGSRCKNL